jgi:hypothetical protein
MLIDFTKEDEFTFWVPATISKAEGPKSKKGKKRRWLQGIASTKDIDLQKEEVYQYGIDFAYFLKWGYFNNDHKPGFKNKVGQPTECKVTKDGLWTKGYLFDNHTVADEIWELALALEASDSDRKLGFSIQGKVLRRSGRKIMKCWIQDIAITAAPINTNTWLDVIKSLQNVPQEMWVCDDHGCYISPSMIGPPVEKAHDCGCDRATTDDPKIRPPQADPEPMAEKGLTGLAIDESEMDLKKDGDEGEKKALSATGPAGQVLVPESLEGTPTDLDYGGAKKPHRHRKTKKKKKKAHKSLTFGQCVDLLCEHRGLSTRDATVVAETVFEMSGISI